MKTQHRGISLVAAALSLMAAAGLAACGTSPDHRSDLAVMGDTVTAVTVPDGTVTGRYLMEGGPINLAGHTANPWPIDGQVIFTASGRTASAARGSERRLLRPPGAGNLHGDGPHSTRHRPGPTGQQLLPAADRDGAGRSRRHRHRVLCGALTRSRPLGHLSA